jgi:hypothetical protein
MLTGRRYAITATMDIILTRARPTVITGLTGLPAESSSALVRGMAGAVVGEAGAVVGATVVALVGLVSADAASQVVAVLPADADSPVDVDLRTVPLVASMAVAADSTVVGADSTVEVVDSTVVAVDTVAAVDTGKSG